MGIAGISVVCDAGPLIHLAEIGCLKLLANLGQVLVPQAVWAETVGQGRISQKDILSLGNVEKCAVSQATVAQFVQSNALADLHSGEQACLCLCLQLGVPTILTDDLAVREAAKRLNLTPVGALGVIVRAYRDGIIVLSAAEQRINDLYQISSLFVTQTIVDLAIAQLHKHVGR